MPPPPRTLQVLLSFDHTGAGAASASGHHTAAGSTAVGGAGPSSRGLAAPQALEADAAAPADAGDGRVLPSGRQEVDV